MPEPKLIPIYDDTAPIACTITNAEIPERVALVERMRAAMTSIDRTPTGLLLHFPGNEVVRADLATFAVDEKRCCQFWGFAIDAPNGELTLHWDGPPDTAELIDRLHANFEGHEPLTADSGLL